jgi:hypothetical protein
MAMVNGYPSIADIDTFFEDMGIEIPTENNPNWIDEFKQFLYGLISPLQSHYRLTVYSPSPTTINVRGGNYNYDGTLKEYTPGEAIDPTDNDTTYVWLTASNTVASGVDGDGWPVTEHIKLAEVDVDSDGYITDIRNRLAEAIVLTPVPAA